LPSILSKTVAGRRIRSNEVEKNEIGKERSASQFNLERANAWGLRKNQAGVGSRLSVETRAQRKVAKTLSQVANVCFGEKISLFGA